METWTYISGATGYAGNLITDYLAREGHNLLIGGKDAMKLSKFSNELKKKYPNLKTDCVETDLSLPEDWVASVSAIKRYDVDIYINCAASQGRITKSSNLSNEDFLKVFNINLFSAIFFSNYFLTNLNPAKKLKIIHFSGGGATTPRSNFMPYSLSKIALCRFIENFYQENQHQPLGINIISPGVMPSKMQSEVLLETSLVETIDYKVAETALNESRFEPEQLLELLKFLLSDNSIGINGKLISAQWDNWKEWPSHLSELQSTGLYTLRRMTARDLGHTWGDI